MRHFKQYTTTTSALLVHLKTVRFQIPISGLAKLKIRHAHRVVSQKNADFPEKLKEITLKDRRKTKMNGNLDKSSRKRTVRTRQNEKNCAGEGSRSLVE